MIFFINFYYQILDKNKTKISRNLNDFLFINLISSKTHYEIKDFSGIAFERMVEFSLSFGKQSFPTVFDKLHLMTYEFNIGTYWIPNKNGTQIDLIVEDDEDKCTRIIDCKWISKFTNSADDFKYEIEKKSFPLKEDHVRKNYFIFSQTPSDRLQHNLTEKDVLWICLDDFF